jgi:hypothetical protein
MNKNDDSDGRFHRSSRDDGHDPHAANSVAWWREATASALDPVYRMALLRRFSLLGFGLGTLGCTEIMWQANAHGQQGPGATEGSDQEDDSSEYPHPWYFPGAIETDARGYARWMTMLPQLAARLAPAQDALLPFYRPTLFQTLMLEQGRDLRALITPIYTSDMCRAYSRGRGLLSLFVRRGVPADTAIIIDAPGPEAIAAGAALAERFDPVFIFDNWPHLRGVVPSHLTLAAALYFAPLLEDLKTRPAPRPPVIVLDSNRLAPYIDAAGDFDNRYMVELPDAQAFARLGIRRLFYVSGRARGTELDDLNGDFVALASAGIDIRLLALDDFRQAGNEQACGGQDAQPFLFGGDEETDQLFWNWYAPLSPPISGSFIVAPPPWLGPRTHYRPSRRPTFLGGPTPVAGGHGGSLSPYHGGLGGGRSGSLGRSHSPSGS